MRPKKQASHTKNRTKNRGQIWRQLLIARFLFVFLYFLFGRMFDRMFGHSFSRGLERMFSASSPAKDSSAPHGPQGQGFLHTSGQHDQRHILDPTRTKMLPTNKAERAWTLQKQTSNTVAHNKSSQ